MSDLDETHFEFLLQHMYPDFSDWLSLDGNFQRIPERIQTRVLNYVHARQQLLLPNALIRELSKYAYL